ncbi:MAG: hypothetical protein OXG80_08980 [Chloroflexi bacterium]|nr:hypothetical protein [Chloroflexota bacterium]
MSKTALAEYESARVQQITQNDARRIRQRVDAAQQNPIRAGVRWPFELIQNAHDAGPRTGDDRVEINFALQNESLIVHHTGKPFSPQELAALLSGGSSKEFDDAETTGRFGTGFLVTHGLSPHVDVEGVISTQEGYEHFQIELVRSGNEASITENIGQANRSLEKATAVPESWTTCNPTASFTYHSVDCNVAQTGLKRLQQALPYLYATCEKLGRVCIDLPDRSVVFTPGTMIEHALDEFTLQETDISVSDSTETKELIAVRMGKKDGQSALLAIIEKCNGQNRLKLPDDDFPRLFVKFPIAGTDFLQFNVVLDGQFTPEQERDGIPMNDDSKNLICAALSSFPILVEHAVKSDWRDAHKLAHLSMPTQTFSGESGSGELEWWRQGILEVAQATAKKSIIHSDEGLLPAIHEGVGAKTVSFLVPSIDADKDDSFDYERIHELASEITLLHIPNKAIAQSWGQIVRQWASIGVPVNRLGIKELTDWVRERCTNINDLPVEGDPFEWLAQLFLLASDAEDLNVQSMVRRLFPDQHLKLRDTTHECLYSDEGIPDEIKDIAAVIDVDLRSKLLHNRMSKALNKPGYESANKLIQELLDGEHDEPYALDAILEKLEASLPDNRVLDENTDLSALRASARLAVYLGNKEDTQRLRKCPLLAADDTVIHLSVNRQILAPVLDWPPSARMYDELYTKSRMLSNRYHDDGTLRVALEPLIANRLVITAPLYQAVREINDPNLLSAMSPDGQNTTGATVRNISFGQIAFLSTDLVQRCGHDPDLAKMLFDFVLNVAACEDQEWRQFKEVNGSRAGEQLPLSLRSSIWPFELKVRSWIPVPFSEDSEEEGYAPVPASETYLRDYLLDSAWLKENSDAVDLLHEVFGFSQLNLIIDGLDEQEKADLVELLQDSGLVESAVKNRELLKSADENPDMAKLISEASPEEIQKIREKLAEQEREAEIREANRNFGYAVQRALATAIESYRLELKPNDRGQDYEVFPGSLNGDLDDVPFSFEVGSYLLEVKATTTGDVRLTPLQAQTASKHPDRFVLSVIDLRGQEIRQSWDASDVEPFAKIVTDIGDDIVEVYEGVDAFTDTDIPVRLRNEQQLRYSISADLWDNGDSIDTWVQSLAALLIPSQ